MVLPIKVRPLLRLTPKIHLKTSRFLDLQARATTTKVSNHQATSSHYTPTYRLGHRCEAPRTHHGTHTPWSFAPDHPPHRHQRNKERLPRGHPTKAETRHTEWFVKPRKPASLQPHLLPIPWQARSRTWWTPCQLLSLPHLSKISRWTSKIPLSNLWSPSYLPYSTDS
jgi:hypothetical protein